MQTDELQRVWEDLPEQDQIELEKLSLSLWCKNRIQRIDVSNFSLDDFPHLKQIYTDKSQKIVIEKSAQQGLTVYGICESFHSTWAGQSRLYFFPTSKMVTKFVQGRYDPLITANPMLADLIKNTDNTTIKQIGTGIVYFSGLGASTKEGGKYDVVSVPVNGITFDEYEMMQKIKIQMAYQRMEGSTGQFVRMFSTPGIPELQ